MGGGPCPLKLSADEPDGEHLDSRLLFRRVGHSVLRSVRFRQKTYKPQQDMTLALSLRNRINQGGR